MNVKLQAQQEQARELFRPLVEQVRTEGFYLFPLRLFMGVGWLRAGVEKLIDPGWYTGDGVREFIASNVEGGLVPFPLFEWFLREVQFPLAIPVAIVVLFTQLLIGLMILLGLYTRTALVWATIMNLHFMIGGRVNPSVFYILMQIVLLHGNSGRILGMDGLIQSPRRRMRPMDPRVRRRLLQTLALFLLVLGLACMPFMRTFDPALLIEDAAAVTVMLLMLGSLWAALDSMR